MADPRSDAVVLFGATGDLARKKLFPALFRLFERGELDLPVIGVARSEWDDAELRQYAARAVVDAVPDVDEDAVGTFTGRLRYVQGDYADPEVYAGLARILGDAAIMPPPGQDSASGPAESRNSAPAPAWSPGYDPAHDPV